jgi:hypothetical protein
VFLPSGNAQVTGVLSYNYVSKIGGRIVSSPSGLPTLPGPGQEIEYVVVVYNTGATTSGGEVIKIEIPYYADFYGASTTGSGTVNVSDAIYWTLPVLTGQGANPQAALDTLIYTLVASQDCYALNANCTQEIAVKGIVPSGWNFYYAYPPLPDSAHLGANTTPVAVTIDGVSAFLAAKCSGKQFREYVYLEDKAVGATIPVSDISKDFPVGAVFYDTIDEVNNTTLGMSIDLTATGFPASAGKNSYYALLGTCWQKFSINVLDTTNVTFCAGEDLRKAVYWISDPDAIVANSGNWYLGLELIPDLSARPLTLADNDSILTYKANFICDNSPITSNKLKIIVHGAAQITKLIPESPANIYCYGDTLGARVSVIKNDDWVKYDWTFGGVAFGGDNDTVTYLPALTTADNGKWLVVMVSNSCDTVRDSVQVFVNPRPFIKDTLAIICSGTAFTITPTDGVHNDTVPNITEYTWIISDTTGTGISGASVQNTLQSDISQTLTNNTFSVQTITYTVTPVSNYGTPQECTGATFDIVVTVNPLPQIILSNNIDMCRRETNTLLTSYPGGTWKSLNDAIATIHASSGLVTAISDGTVTMRYTVSTPEGCVDSADISVKVKALPILDIAGSNSICKGTTTQLVSNETGTWTSLNTSVATVDSDGVVTGHTVGQARFLFTSTATGCIDTTDVVTVGDFIDVDPITATTNIICEGSSGNNTVQLSCTTTDGVWTISDNSKATIVSQTSNPATATISGVAAGRVFVTYTVGQGTCQSKSTYLLKIVPTTTPKIIIGFER